MKKISAIFSVLAIAVLAIVTMGCPVAYQVSNPYSIADVTVAEAASTTIPIETTLGNTLQLPNDAVRVTGNWEVISSGDWNFNAVVYMNGPGIPLNTTLVATKVNTNWWSAGLSNYYVLGGTGTTYENNVGGTLSSPGNWGGGVTIATGTFDIDMSAAVAGDITLTTAAPGTSSWAGTVKITGLKIYY